YLHTDQSRYATFGAHGLASLLGARRFRGGACVAYLPPAGRLGWARSLPSFNRNPLVPAEAAAAAGTSPPGSVTDDIHSCRPGEAMAHLRSGRLTYADTDADAPVNFPRVMLIWRASLLGSSGNGMEYSMRRLLGAENAVRAEETPPGKRPREIVWRNHGPRG